MEACAGIAALIKTVLVLEHGVIPPTISAKTLNSKIPFATWNLSVPTTLTPFPGTGLRRVSVNSFGFCGTNAHAIVDDAYSYLTSRGITNGNHFTTAHSGKTLTNGDGGDKSDDHARAPLVFALSSQDREGIKRVRQSLVDYLGGGAAAAGTKQSGAFLANLAHTLNTRRTHHQWKTYAVASSAEELVGVLDDAETPRPEYLQSSSTPRIGFVFTGQGAQWAGMGMELMAYPTFRASIVAADNYLKHELGCPWSAEEELTRPKAESKLGIAEYSQPLCTVLQVALVDLLKEWGITPVAVTGHSSGEIGAAYCIEALSREDAWKVAYYRGVLSTALQDRDGSMMAVGMSPEAASDVISRVAPGQVVVACINSPSSVTLSGDTAGIDKLLAVLTEDGVFARKLHVDTAYHSHHMQAVAADYMESMLDIHAKPGIEGCVMQSSAAGGIVAANKLGPAHWVRNLVSPVQFASAVQGVVRPVVDGETRSSDNAVDILVEVGPHSALQGPSLQSLKAIGVTNVPYLSALSRGNNGVKTCLSLAGDLFARSFPVDLVAANIRDATSSPKTLVHLPKYPWNHQNRYWAETRYAREQRMRMFPPQSLLGAPMPSPAAGEHAWRGYMRIKEQPWVQDHQVQGSILYPGAGFLAMAIEAAAQVASSGDGQVCGFQLRNVQLVLPMVLQEDHDVEYTIVLRPHLTGTMSTGSTWTEFVISSSPDGTTFERNCLGLILTQYAESADLLESASMQSLVDGVTAKCVNPVAADAFYDDLTALGLAYGPTFQNVSSITVGPSHSAVVVDVPDVGLEDAVLTGQRPHIIHPALLDAVFHSIFAAVMGAGELTTAMIPKTIDSVVVSMNAPFHAGHQFSGICQTRPQGLKEYMADISMMDPNTNTAVLKIQGLCCTKIAGDAQSAADDTPVNALCTKMVWRPHLYLAEEQDAAPTVSPALLKLAELIALMHHANPALTLVEVATSDQITLPSLQLEEDAAEIFTTTAYRIACPQDVHAAVSERVSTLQGVNHQIMDLEECISSETFIPDCVIAAASDESDASQSTIIKALFDKLPAVTGRLCLVGKVGASLDQLLMDNDPAWKNKTSKVFADDTHTITVISKAAAPPTTADPSDQVVVLTGADTAVASQLTVQLEARGLKPKVISWDDAGAADAVRDRRCISLVELDKPHMEQLDEDTFYKLTSIMSNALHVLWVIGTAADSPGSAMMTGMLRVLHNEVPGLDPISVCADAASRSRPDELSRTIARIFSSPMGEREFQILNGIPHICRLVPDEPLNGIISRLTGPKDAQEPEDMSLGEAAASASGRPLRLSIGKPGQLDSIRFEADDAPERPLLQPDEIEIDVRVSALNFRDVMSIMDMIPSPTLGIEAAGLVRRVGSDVSDLAVGDRVALIGNDAHASVMRGKASHAFKMPDAMTYEEAASLPIVSYTAWYALVHIAKARKGQTVLIHAGTGGVGQAALQLARHLGLEIFTTVSSDEKRQLVHGKYGVAKDHILGSRDLGFAHDIMRLTNGRGVDIVLNSLAGEALRRSWECLAPSGHFVEIGLKDIVDDTRLGMRPFMRGASFTSVNLKDMWDNQADLMAEVVQGTRPYLVDGVIKPADPLTAYPISGLVKALRLLQSGKHKGKLVVQWTSDATVPVLRSAAPPLDVSQGVILLVGGMGGLGRSIARMLVAHGAKKLCFLSRSAGATSAQGRQLLDELAAQGVETRVIAADASDAASLAKGLAQCTAELGAIRGVFQCAAVLRDALFSNMTYSDWTGSTRSKVQGSQNLSAALPSVDFFILLSSFAGVFGNRGQTNYAAGCAFQDALAVARRAAGQAAVSVDLGVMRDVGALAENGAMGDIKEWERVWGIREDKFLALMRLCMQAGEVGIGARVVTGLGTRAGSLAAGIKAPYYFETDARFSVLASIGGNGSQDAGAGAAGAEQGQALSAMIQGSASVQEASQHVLSALVGRVAKMLDLPPTDLDTGRFLHSYGVDSLGAIEIVNWALREIQARIAVFDVMAGVPMTVFSERVAAKSGLLVQVS